jgi:translation elongation factor EF-4
MTPELTSTGQLCTGQVGYVITGMKSTRSARVGDTWHLIKQPVDPLPGFKASKSMVFAGRPLSGRMSHKWIMPAGTFHVVCRLSGMLCASN